MEDQDCIFLCDYEDLTLFHLLAKGNPFGKLKGIAVNPLAFDGSLIVLELLNLLKCSEEQLIVKGIVEY